MEDQSPPVVSLYEQKVALRFSAKFSDVIENLARTEDLKYSPDGNRLAIAGFAKNTVEILTFANHDSFDLVGALTLDHERFIEPHGVDWLDDNTLVVGNRAGRVVFVDVPNIGAGIFRQAAVLKARFKKANLFTKIQTPGSVAVAQYKDETGLWVCNNYAQFISYHALKQTKHKVRSKRNIIAITHDLDLPDGVTINATGAFMAISNHNTHQVFLYAIEGYGKARRIGELNNLQYPHGVRFMPDGNTLFVADAGQPYVVVFETKNGWKGSHFPTRLIQVMDDATFLRGRQNPQEGGIKGIDIDMRRGVLAATCETQTLSFFPLNQVLGIGGAS